MTTEPMNERKRIEAILNQFLDEHYEGFRDPGTTPADARRIKDRAANAILGLQREAVGKEMRSAMGRLETANYKLEKLTQNDIDWVFAPWIGGKK